MTLSRTRLELLHRIAEKKEKDAQSLLADAQKKLTEKQNMHRELQTYLGEYERQSPTATSAMLLENQRQFLMRLHNAGTAQLQAVANAKQKLELVRLEWLQKRKDLQIAETMLEQGRQEALRVSERQSQRDMDEFATMRQRPTAQYS
jgi:flagellar protein FliJ